MVIAARVVVRANDRQTSVLSLRARVGLQGAAREPSHRAEILREFLSSIEKACVNKLI